MNMINLLLVFGKAKPSRSLDCQEHLISINLLLSAIDVTAEVKSSS